MIALTVNEGKTIQYHLRTPDFTDGLRLHHLVKLCPPLDVNSEYLYFLIGRDFASTSVIAEQNSQSIGFISGYYRPQTTCFFVWQVAVHPEYRGHGIAMKMLEWITEKNPFDSIETTISPSNMASKSLFESFARKKGLSIIQKPFLDSYKNTAGETHEKEDLFRLIPHTNKEK